MEDGQALLLLSQRPDKCKRRVTPEHSAAEPRLRELTRRFPTETNLYLPPVVTHLQNSRRFISVTFNLYTLYLVTALLTLPRIYCWRCSLSSFSDPGIYLVTICRFFYLNVPLIHLQHTWDGQKSMFLP